MKKIKVSILISMLILGFIIFLLSTPIVNYEKPIDRGYYLYNTHPHWGIAYSKLMVPINITTFGILGSFIHLIPIKYNLYNLLATIITKHWAISIFIFLLINDEKNMKIFNPVIIFKSNTIVIIYNNKAF